LVRGPAKISHRWQAADLGFNAAFQKELTRLSQQANHPMNRFNTIRLIIEAYNAVPQDLCCKVIAKMQRSWEEGRKNFQARQFLDGDELIELPLVQSEAIVLTQDLGDRVVSKRALSQEKKHASKIPKLASTTERGYRKDKETFVVGENVWVDHPTHGWIPGCIKSIGKQKEWFTIDLREGKPIRVRHDLVRGRLSGG
jgi:hypothetical protein